MEKSHQSTRKRQISNYRALTIPKELYNALVTHMQNSNGFYVSVSEVVREALRDYLNTQANAPYAQA